MIGLPKVMANVVVSKCVMFGQRGRGHHGAVGYETLDASHLPLVLLVEIFSRQAIELAMDHDSQMETSICVCNDCNPLSEIIPVLCTVLCKVVKNWE